MKKKTMKEEVKYTMDGLESVMIKQVIPSKLDDRFFFVIVYCIVLLLCSMVQALNMVYSRYFGPKISKRIGHLVFQAWCVSSVYEYFELLAIFALISSTQVVANEATDTITVITMIIIIATSEWNGME